MLSLYVDSTKLPDPQTHQSVRVKHAYVFRCVGVLLCVCVCVCVCLCVCVFASVYECMCG